MKSATDSLTAVRQPLRGRLRFEHVNNIDQRMVSAPMVIHILLDGTVVSVRNLDDGLEEAAAKREALKLAIGDKEVRVSEALRVTFRMVDGTGKTESA
jgi:hypothetical protein